MTKKAVEVQKRRQKSLGSRKGGEADKGSVDKEKIVPERVVRKVSKAARKIGTIYSAKKLRTYRKISVSLFIIGSVLFYLYYGRHAYYIFTNKLGVERNTRAILETAQETDRGERPQTEEVYYPPFNPELPEENTLAISSINVETRINEAPFENYEDALRVGVWRVDDFGTPSERKRPIILTAHRYGYLSWSIPYRLKNSFFNLPKVEVGDRVEIVWEQRKYVYEVYAEEKGEEITDYQADLILYTCQDLNSPVRIFKYAKLLEV
jgi:sortase (surface protein transpeptidase)